MTFHLPTEHMQKPKPHCFISWIRSIITFLSSVSIFISFIFIYRSVCLLFCIRSSLCFFVPLSFSSLTLCSLYFPLPSLQTPTQCCHITCSLFLHSPTVANTPLILTRICNSRTTDSHCSSMRHAPPVPTVPSKHYRPHWTLQAPLDTTVPIGNYWFHWTPKASLDTTGPTGYYWPHWTLQTPLNTTGPTGHHRPHWTLQA
jgi:hypothetical protein